MVLVPQGRSRWRYLPGTARTRACAGLLMLLVALAFRAATGPAGAQEAGLVAAYSFDEASGATFADASGNNNAGTVSGATWGSGRFGSALAFDGLDDLASVPDANSLDLSAGMTLEAWVYPTALSDWRSIVIKERPGHLCYAIYGNTDTNRPSAEVATGGSGGDTRGQAQLALNIWTHVAATYDGATLRFYIGGVEVSSRPMSGAIVASADPLRIGGNAVWGEHFTGSIDEVRVYNRALTPAEIQQDMNRPVGSDTTAPVVTSVTPLPGATAVHTAMDVSAVFSEAMDATTITAATVTLRDAAGTLVPASIRFDGPSRSAILDPTEPLALSSSYTATIAGGAAGVKDAGGVALAADYQWAFTTTADADTPIVVTRSPAPGAINVASTVSVSAVFNEPMQPASLVFDVLNAAGVTVPATFSYDAATLTAVLRPSEPLQSQSRYTATVRGAADLAGNPIAGPVSWTFTTGTVGFHQSIVFSGLSEPTAVEFASDGRVFVAEKSGIIKVFDNLSDVTPTVFADLRTSVHNFWDRGLLGMALDPLFPARPYVYVLYAYDAAIGGTAPRWGFAGGTSDPCPTPPGATDDGCVISGRLSRLEASGNVQVGPERVLIEDWGQQFPSHSIGHLAFGADGALYATGGDGASFNFTDYGQTGNPRNPLGDPPVPVGGVQSPPAAEGGALRSQDVRTPADPAGLGGTVIRIDPETGAAMPDNPLAASADANARRIIAFGLRNPFRFAFRPGTRELYIGDVGWSEWEEVNRIDDTATSALLNFGWPCYEGAPRQSGYDAAGLTLCESLYSQPGAVVAPFFAYRHRTVIAAGDTCGTGSSSISGLAFYDKGTYPQKYAGALFMADYSRNCIWTMFAGPDGRPNPANVATFVAGAAGPVQLKTGPGGDLFYVALEGTIRRIQFFDGSRPPTASIAATPDTGAAPLAVTFDGSTSSDPDAGDQLSYAWDLDGDGFFDDGSEPVATYTYAAAGVYTVRLRVTDTSGLADVRSTTISADSAAPTASILSPAATLKWRVGDSIVFSGTGSDPDDGELPASAFEWQLVMQHCSTLDSCHAHPLQTFSGVTGGSFVPPDHEYPSFAELTLTVTDSTGLSASQTVRLDPDTVVLTFETEPSGLSVAVGSGAAVTPFTRTVIIGSSNSVSAASPQTMGGAAYEFVAWSDAGAAAHDVIAPATPTTYRAAYAPVPTVSIADAVVAEADAGSSSTMSFLVSLSSSTSRTVTVDYSVTGGSASSGTDYTPASGTLTFAPGETSLPIAIPVAGDALDEADETIVITLSNPVNVGTGDAQGQGTIIDNDPAVTISVNDVETIEGSGGTATAVFTVSLSGFSGVSVSVAYATAPGTAAAPADFTATSGTLVFLPGSLRGTVAVPVQADLVDELDETLFLNLSAPVNGTIADGQGVALIRDDDAVAAPSLVAAYGFEEESGLQVIDASGYGHTGTISGATRLSNGRFGRAIRFDGLDDVVTIADSDALDLQAGMTIEAWVFVRDLRQHWRSLLVKESADGLVYAMYANTTGNVPSGEITTSAGSMDVRGVTRLTTGVWTHMAVTYDGAALRLFINGTLVSARAATGSLITSSGALTLGGNSVWGEHFEGFIDEVRIYNRALTAAEIRTDMARPVQ